MAGILVWNILKINYCHQQSVKRNNSVDVMSNASMYYVPEMSSEVNILTGELWLIQSPNITLYLKGW